MFKNIIILLILIASLIICYIFYNVFILEQFDIHCDTKSGLYNPTVCKQNKIISFVDGVFDIIFTNQKTRRRR